MKYEVIGWTVCDYPAYSEHKNITACVDRAIIKELREHNYLFGGDVHEDYCPVLNDGTFVNYSWRGWGRIMAIAHGVEGDYAYMFAYMNRLLDPKKIKLPKRDEIDSSKIVPKDTLVETHVMYLTEDMFEAVKAGTKTIDIRLFDEKGKAVDIEDYIEFRKTGDDSARLLRRVADIDDIEKSFKKLFTKIEFGDDFDIYEVLKYTPQSLGAPENSTIESLVDLMHTFYSEEQEAEHGAIAFVLEEPAYCKTQLKVILGGDEGMEVYTERLEQIAAEGGDVSQLVSEGFDRALADRALSEICEGYEWTNYGFLYGENEEYDVDVNNMIRKTLGDLIGKAEFIRGMRDRFCAVFVLDIYAVIDSNSDKPRQNLTLDDDIKRFLEASLVKLNLRSKTL